MISSRHRGEQFS